MKLCQAVIVMCVLAVGTLSWAYPFDFTQDLTPEVKAVVHVMNNGGMQIATVQFMYENQTIDSVTLTPMSPTRTNLRYVLSNNKMLMVSNLTLQAAMGMSPGRVMCSGKVIDRSGSAERTFNLRIAQWTN